MTTRLSTVDDEIMKLIRMIYNKNKNKINLNATIPNHDRLFGGPHGGYSNELSIFHLNIQKNILKADKLDVVELYAKTGADIIFIYEPGLDSNFPMEKFYNYDLTPINNKYLIVLTKTSSKLTVEEVVTTEATIMAKVTGRQLTAIGTYNRRSKDRVGKDDLDKYTHEERYINLKIALTKGLCEANKRCVIGGDFNLDLTQSRQKNRPMV